MLFSFVSEEGEIILSSCHLSTISLKKSHIFKIVRVNNQFLFDFFFFFSNLSILNGWESFSETVDHVAYPP